MESIKMNLGGYAMILAIMFPIWVLIAFAVIVEFWTQVSAWSSVLAAGVMASNPMAIFIAVAMLAVLTAVVFGRRRS